MVLGMQGIPVSATGSLERPGDSLSGRSVVSLTWRRRRQSEAIGAILPLRNERKRRHMASLRAPCPPGVCTCERDAVLADPAADARALLLNRQEEQRLLERLENVTSVTDLQRLQRRLQEQLGIQLEIEPGPGEVRSARGMLIELQPRPGLCRKLHQTIPAAVRRGLNQRPEVLFALLNANDLLRDA